MSMPLEGIRVLDMTTAYSGPVCTLQLADYGAEVIKIERTKYGDAARTWPSDYEMNPFFVAMNRNKKSISLNLKSEKGKEIFKELVKDADVVVENFRAGVMARMGLGYDVLKEINPGIIMASLCGYGQTGPYSDRSCYSNLAEAMSGILSTTGAPDGMPYGSGVAFGDSVGGMFTLAGILMALYHREKTGEGQWIDVAMTDSLFALNEGAATAVDIQGHDDQRMGNRDPAAYPYDAFEAKDGWCILSVADVNDWSNFAHACELDELVDDPRFKTNNDRCKNADILWEYITAWSKQHTRDEIEKRFDENRAGFARINTIGEAMKNEQMLARDMIIEVEDQWFGKIKQNGFPIKMSTCSAELRCPAPRVGQHNEEYLSKLGYSEADLQALREEGIID